MTTTCRARIATRGVSGAGSRTRRVGRGPRSRSRLRRRRRRRGDGRDATATETARWYPCTRDTSRNSRRTGGILREQHPRDTSRTFRDGRARVETPRRRRRRRRAGGSRQTSGGASTAGASTASRVSKRYAGGRFSRTGDVFDRPLHRGFIPTRAWTTTRVDARPVCASRTIENGRWRGFARRSRRFLPSATRARWAPAGDATRSATESTARSARARVGWRESAARRRRRRRRGRERRARGRFASRG